MSAKQESKDEVKQEEVKNDPFPQPKSIHDLQIGMWVVSYYPVEQERGICRRIDAVYPRSNRWGSGDILFEWIGTIKTPLWAHRMNEITWFGDTKELALEAREVALSKMAHESSTESSSVDHDIVGA